MNRHTLFIVILLVMLIISMGINALLLQGEQPKDAYYRGMHDYCENSYVVNAQGEKIKTDPSKIYPGGCAGLVAALEASGFYERHTK